jgi:hypothetical protein
MCRSSRRLLLWMLIDSVSCSMPEQWGKGLHNLPLNICVVHAWRRAGQECVCKYSMLWLCLCCCMCGTSALASLAWLHYKHSSPGLALHSCAGVVLFGTMHVCHSRYLVSYVLSQCTSWVLAL